MKSNDDQYKIGVSTQPKRRLKELQTGNSEIIEIVEEYETDKPYMIEKILHNRFSIYKEHNEWFNLSLKDEVEFVETCKKIEENLKFLIENNNVFIK